MYAAAPTFFPEGSASWSLRETAASPAQTGKNAIWQIGLPTSNLENNYMENGPFVDGLPIFMTSLIHFQLLQK